MGNALAAAAELGVDATPMEGFEADKYNEALRLKEQRYSIFVLLALGKRHEEDSYQHAPKTRRSLEDLFESK